METMRTPYSSSNPCADEQSGQDTCVHGSEPPEQVMARLNQKQRETNPEDARWMAAPLSELTDHIRSRHHQYVRTAIPEVRGLLKKVSAQHGINHPEVVRAEAIFLQIGQDMISHMQKEEQILFPYIEGLERAVKAAETPEPPFFQTVRNPIQVMMKEHDLADDLFGKIRQETRGYTPPADACLTYESLYRELQAFDQDFHVHAHLEDSILFPRAVEMEDASK